MMRILALDQASSTGFAHGVPGQIPIYGTYRMPSKKGAGIGARHAAFEDWLRDLIRSNEIDKVFFEAPNRPSVTSLGSQMLLYGLASHIAVASYREGRQCSAIPVQTWRSEFGIPQRAPTFIKGTDKRRAWLKQRSIDRCRNLGLDPNDDNAAEAVGIWFICCQRILAKEAEPTFDFTDKINI